MNKELEEAAEKRIPTSTKVWDLTETRRNDFIAGALWQQEQSKELEKEQELKEWFETWSAGYDSGFNNCMKKFNNKQQIT
jgi:hypothetical protein